MKIMYWQVGQRKISGSFQKTRLYFLFCAYQEICELFDRWVWIYSLIISFIYLVSRSNH